MSKRTILVISLTGLALVACSAKGPSSIRLVANGGLIEGAPGGYCWDRALGPTVCVDPLEPQFDSPVSLPPGGPISLQLDKPLPETVTLSLSQEVFGQAVISEVVPVAGSLDWSPQVEQGQYILNVDATWPQGATTYRFSILLGAASPPPPPPSASPPLIRLVAEGTTVDAWQGPYCWDDGGGAQLCVDPIEPQFVGAFPLPDTDPIRLQLDLPLPETVTLSLSQEVFGEAVVTEAVPVAGTIEWSPQVEVGEYFLDASAKWPQGDASYLFKISLESGQATVDSPPLIRLKADDTLFDGWQSSYCWVSGDGAELCVDALPPTFDSIIQIPADGQIRLKLEEPLPDSVSLSLSEAVNAGALVSDSVEPEATIKWSPQIGQGEYILGVSATWPQGEVSYAFGIALGSPVVTTTTTYTVQRGDRLYLISRLTGTSVGDLVNLNAGAYPSLLTRPELIHPGWALTTNGAAAPVGAGTHTVQRGERLYRIALAYGTTVEVLVQMNAGQYPGLSTNPHLIQPGWVLALPT